MSEINNNGFSEINKINKIKYRNIMPEKPNGSDMPVSDNSVEKKQDIVPDTGVLGRSQIKGIKGGDITKSVDEAIALVTKNPKAAQTGDAIFDYLYERYMKEGKSPDEAYALASMGLEEFLNVPNVG